MAAKQMGLGVDEGGNAKEFIGTAAEMAGVDTTRIGAGSTYWATDAKAGYVWDGGAWCALG